MSLCVCLVYMYCLLLIDGVLGVKKNFKNKLELEILSSSVRKGDLEEKNDFLSNEANNQVNNLTISYHYSNLPYHTIPYLTLTYPILPTYLVIHLPYPTPLSCQINLYILETIPITCFLKHALLYPSQPIPLTYFASYLLMLPHRISL